MEEKSGYDLEKFLIDTRSQRTKEEDEKQWKLNESFRNIRKIIDNLPLDRLEELVSSSLEQSIEILDSKQEFINYFREILIKSIKEILIPKGINHFLDNYTKHPVSGPEVIISMQNWSIDIEPPSIEWPEVGDINYEIGFLPKKIDPEYFNENDLNEVFKMIHDEIYKLKASEILNGQLRDWLKKNFREPSDPIDCYVPDLDVEECMSTFGTEWDSNIQEITFVFEKESDAILFKLKFC